MKKTKPKRAISRRGFLGGTGAVVAAAATGSMLQAQRPTGPPATGAGLAVPRTTIRVLVNGVSHRVDVEDRWTLAELLRDHLNLTGTKLGCERGECAHRVKKRDPRVQS